MSSSITIESINYDGEEAQVLFLPDNSNQTINLGTVILPFIFYPSLLIPPREVYGTYTIVVDSVSCRPNCTNIVVVPRPTPTPTPTISDPNDKTPPIISDVVVPSTLKAGSSITATFRVRDDVGVKLIGKQPFVVAYLWQGATKIDVPYQLTQLVSGDVKDGNYTITFTGTQGLSGNYQIKFGAYDVTSKSAELISPDISIVP